MNLLHIDASILGGNSVSRKVSAAIVERLSQARLDVRVTYRDLAATPLPHLSGDNLAAIRGAVPESATLHDDIVVSQKVLDEFLAADTIVIGAPMYNFTIPSQLKTWIDRILVAGKTFSYTAAGPQGLAGTKRVIIAISRGGLYGPGTPASAAEHLETYLRTVFGFIGVRNVEIIAAEGLNIGPEQREQSIAGALQQAVALRAA